MRHGKQKRKKRDHPAKSKHKVRDHGIVVKPEWEESLRSKESLTVIPRSSQQAPIHVEIPRV